MGSFSTCCSVTYWAILESFHVNTCRLTSLLGKSVRCSTVRTRPHAFHCLLLTRVWLVPAFSPPVIFPHFGQAPFPPYFHPPPLIQSICLQYRADVIFEKNFDLQFFVLKYFKLIEKLQKQYNDLPLEILAVNILPDLLFLAVFFPVYLSMYV